ncbi:MAG: hypothetical protein ACFFDR_14420 [Candidatus Thorarchaeota archaeon]
MSILRYETQEGKQEEFQIESNATTVRLIDMRISRIDLSPLESHQDLQELNLSMNKLETIDLSPLKSCTSIEKLNLQNNSFKTVDLSHFSGFTSFKYLDLTGNKIEVFDITPLVSCPKLEFFALDPFTRFRGPIDPRIMHVMRASSPVDKESVAFAKTLMSSVQASIRQIERSSVRQMREKEEEEKRKK